MIGAFQKNHSNASSQCYFLQVFKNRLTELYILLIQMNFDIIILWKQMTNHQMMQHAVFSNGHSSYLLGKLNWTPIPFQAKKSFNIPSKRYLHTSIIYQGNLYILGGIDNETDFKDNRMYCLELMTMKWTIIEGKNFSESRNSHSCTLFKNQIYFFGGSQHQSNPTNDFFKFNPAQTTWIQIECEEPVPPQRELAIFTSINDQYILLYGGIDILQDKIFDDAYLYKNKKWAKINIFNNPSERIKMGIAICGRRIFMFGGEGPCEESSAIFDNLYELTINQFELEVTFKEMFCKGKKPQKRTAHGMVGISSGYFLVYGGQGRLIEQNGNSEGCIFGDIWIYDLERIQWFEISTIDGSSTPRYQFSLSFQNNELFVFGGMNEQHTVIDDFARLQFMQYHHQEPQICQNCQKQYKFKQQSKTTEFLQPSLSTGFYYNLAMEISFPFRAIQMIAQIAEDLASDNIKIYSAKTIEQFDYMCFQFQAKIHLQSSSFLNMVQDSRNMFEANILYNLKIASFRLGKTFLYTQVDDQQRRVFLMSADNRYAPNYEQIFIHYAYVQKLSNYQIYYGRSYGDKQTIYNILKSQVEDPYSLLSRGKGNFLTIFQMNILPTVQKAYYYQLIFYYEPHCDIKIYHNEKKSQLLQTLGYNITILPDFSLKSYLKYSKLKRKIKTYLNNDESCLLAQNYLDYLRKQKNTGTIQQLSLGKLSSKLVQKCIIFRCIEDKYLQNNQGILIYCGNWLIDRYDSKLGHLISDKFYKKKYKKRQNIFKYAGVIYLSSNLNLNQNKTKAQNKFKYNQIIQELICKIKQTQNNDNFEEKQFDQLYERLCQNRQNNKKLKRQ